MKAFNKRTIYSIEISALLLGSMLFAAYYTIKRLHSRDFWVKHTHEVLIHTSRIQLFTNRSEKDAQYFILTGNESFIKRFNNSSQLALTEFDTVKNLTSDNRAIQPVLDSIAKYLNKRISFSDQLIDLRKTKGEEYAIRLIQTGIGENYSDRSLVFMQFIEQDENKLMLLRKADSEAALNIMNVTLLITLGVIVVLVILLIKKTREENTERRRLMEVLLSNDERMKRAENLASFGTWNMNIDNNTINLSEEMRRIWGFDNDKSQCTVQDLVQKVHPDDQNLFHQKMDHLHEQVGVYSYTLRLIDKGQVKYISNGVAVSRDTDDKILSITGYVQDVTEKTFSAINLEDAYRELSLLFKHIDEVFFSRDVVSNRLTQISPTCERLFGYTPDEFEQNPGLWAKIIHPEDRKTAEQQNKLLANGLPLFNQYRIIRKDKAIRFVENKIIPTLDAAGRLIRIDGFTLDITEKTQSARERERIIADLIQRNNTLEEFTYIVSHNLRVPIANILGLGIVLKDIDTDPNERQATIDFILSSVRSLDLIVHDLNTVLQVREEVRGKKEPVFFNELVFDVENSLNLVLAGKDIHIHCDFEQISNIFSLRNYLYSIFYNLILNSINYRREGIETRISIRSDLSNSDVILTFTDNGKGIDLEKNGDTLFGLYRRYDTSVEGKGMGLFMVKTQVLALGGTVDVKSKPGKGTTFVITLPLHSQ